MKSRPTREGIDALRSMPKVARVQLNHVLRNAACIIRGLAEQIRDDGSKAAFNEARAQVIMNTIDELMEQLRNMTAEPDHPAHVDALKEE